jgi:hypothetical protein
MGSKKLATLLREGKITKAEYDSRLAQSAADKKFTSQVSKPERRQVKNVRKLAIPAYKQDALMALTSNSSDSSLVRKYLAALVAPKYNMCRVPDSDVRATVLVRSIQVYDITASTTYINPDSGRFGMFIQPILGSPSQIGDYKIGIVSNGSNWPVQFTLPENWLSTLGAQDPRIDNFTPTLTGPVPGYWSMGGQAGNTSQPFSGSPIYTSLTYNYGQVYAQPPGEDIFQFYPPPGLFLFSGYLLGTGLTGFSLNCSFATQIYVRYSADNTVCTFAYLLSVATPGLMFDPTLTAGNTTASQVTLTEAFTSSQSLDPPVVPPLNYGLVTAIRPVAMSALASYIGPLLTNGGNIAGAWLPSQTLNNQIISDSIGSGPTQNLMNWENLAKVPESYDGPIKDGIYVWWSEQDITTTKFYSPSDSLNADYPILAVSGQWNPGSGVTVQTPVIRLEVVTTYEFTTTSLLFESEVCVGSQAQMDAANMRLAGQPHAMPNGKHMDWIKGMLQKASSTYQSNKSWLNPLLKSAGTAALTLL